MIKIVLTLTTPFFFFALWGQDSGAVKETRLDIVLGMDKVHTLDFVPNKYISISNPEVVNYEIIPSRKEIIFKGLKGDSQAMATIRDTAGEIRLRLSINVTRSNLSDKLEQIKAFLGDVEGLEIGIKGNSLYVGGEIVVPEDLGKITTILALHPEVIQLYELSPHTQEVIAQKMQDELKKFGLKDVTVRIVNKIFWLEGIVPKAEDKELALSIVQAFVPDRVQNLAAQSDRIERLRNRPAIENFITVTPPKQTPPPPPKMIKIVAQFVELSKNYNKIFGLKWGPTLASGGGTIQFGKTVSSGVTTKSDGTFSGTISNLFPQLASAKSAGYARVIQSGMVLAIDRQASKISKSSNIPFLLGAGVGQRQLTVKPTFTLEVFPTILDKDKIQLGVGVTVTIAQGSESTSNSVQTSLLVDSKETAVVGGIAVNEGHTNYDKDPPYGADVVDPQTGSPLFSFLKSKSHTLNKSQFVVFLTPEIIDSPAQATSEIRRKFRQRRQ